MKNDYDLSDLTIEEAKELLRKERDACKTAAQHAEWASSERYLKLVEYIYNKKEENK